MPEQQTTPHKQLLSIGWLEVTIILLAFAADRLSKWWAAAFFAEHGTTQLNALFTLTQTYNRGLALGFLQGIASFMGWISLLIVFVLLLYLNHLPPAPRLARVGLAIVIGAASGNMIDRILFGEVLDFISTPFHASIFNISDVLIYVGIFAILLTTFFPHQTQATAASPDLKSLSD